MASSNGILFFTLSLISTLMVHISFAFDPRPLQDFCVATCKDPKTVTANDFFFSGLNMAANGFFPPHTHPRASEVLVVTKGAVEYKYYSKILREGDAFIFPVGLVQNVAKKNSVVLAAFDTGFLAAAFKLVESTVKNLPMKSWY